MLGETALQSITNLTPLLFGKKQPLQKWVSPSIMLKQVFKSSFIITGLITETNTVLDANAEVRESTFRRGEFYEKSGPGNVLLPIQELPYRFCVSVFCHGVHSDT